MRYTFPNTYAEEQAKNEGPIRATATGFGGIQVVTQKGPVGVPVRHRTFEAWKKVFGEREARSDAAYEAKQFFDEGGFELITVRQVHYSDITDKESFTGGVAVRNISTGGAGATSAEKVTGSFPANLNPGDTVILDVDDLGPATATFDAAAGYQDDTTTYPVTDQDGLNITITLDGGAAQTITFSGVTTSVQSIINQINSQLDGGKAEDDGGGQLRVLSDTKGTGSSVLLGAGTSGLTFASAVAGTGDVINIDAVTLDEFEAVMELDTTALVADNGDNTATISSPTTGTSSELDFTGGTGLAALGLSVETINGTAAGATYPTLRLEAGYHGDKSPGVAGNLLGTKIISNPRKISAGAGSDLATDASATDTALEVTSHKGLSKNSVIKIWDGTNTEYKIVDEIRTTVVAGVVSFYVDLTVGLTNPFTAALTQIQSMEFDIEVYEDGTLVETLLDNSMLDVADNYVETQVNDENLGSQYVVATDLDADPPGLGADTPAADADPVLLAGGTDETTGLVVVDWIGDEGAKTGLYSWDDVDEFMPICTPGMNESAVVNAAAQYVEERIWFEYITYVDEGMSSTDAISWRNNVLGLSSSYVTLYAGGSQVYDPEGSGSNPRRNIAGLGYVMGLRSRVDDLPSPSGGPWHAPAGEGDYGDSRVALDVVTVYSQKEAGNMNDVGINTFQKFGPTQPVRCWGVRTLDDSPQSDFKYVNVRRFFQFAEKSIVDSTRWGVFRNNDFRLWGKLKDAVDTWLTGLMPDGAFPTPIKDLAFYVKMGIPDGTMDATDVDNGLVIGEVGIAPNKPGEFIVWRFTQYESGWDVLEQAV
jgi:hypothetical protein